MKKILFALLLFIASSALNETKAQVYSPYYVNYNGWGLIYYPYGYYQGPVSNGFAHGTGTFYWYDGSFFRGNYYGGWLNGSGVFVSRMYGYVTGCWANGNFIGACFQTPNPYNNQNVVQQTVREVQQSVPKSTSQNQTQAYDPDGYKITQIDPTTQMGQQLLGGYSANGK